jgi:hypothetical protein
MDTTLRGVPFAAQITAAAARYHLDPKLLAAVGLQETGLHNVVGDGGHGHGVFQIDDRWHAFAKSAAAMDPGENADYAAAMLSGLLKRYGGNVHAALSAYNAGSPDATGTLTDWHGTLVGYADSVLLRYQKLGGSGAPLADAGAGRDGTATTASSKGDRFVSFGTNFGNMFNPGGAGNQFINGLMGAGETFVATGGNLCATVAGGLAGAATGSATSTIGNIGNAGLDSAQQSYLNQTNVQEEQQLNFQLQMQQQANMFNDMTDEKSEIMREANTLRNVSMEQKKADTEITKEFIKSIG